MTTTMPPLLVTQGDAAGIGPEVALKALQRLPEAERGPAVLVGDLAAWRRSMALLADPWPLASLDGPGDVAQVPPRCLGVWAPPGLPPGLDTLPWGQVDPRAGRGAARCIEAAVAMVQAGQGAAVVTAPIHKEALAAAGVPYPGHTEMLQALAASPGAPPPPVRMMLANDELRVVLVTVHMALRRALDAITFDAVLGTIRIADEALRRAGIAAPRIAVAGLNPHAGEGGLFGDEELQVIAPAVQAARAAGLDASGPHAPDTVFMRARRGAFDVVVAMTHDHGLIPVKYLGLDEGVNVTLGLPFVRTSPDHGTAFDIAGRGVADPSSMRAALRLARRLAAPS